MKEVSNAVTPSDRVAVYINIPQYPKSAPNALNYITN
jgi:hypothetical protein